MLGQGGLHAVNDETFERDSNTHEIEQLMEEQPRMQSPPRQDHQTAHLAPVPSESPRNGNSKIHVSNLRTEPDVDTDKSVS